jgi:DNA-binding NarL/FixJ family response regulator
MIDVLVVDDHALMRAGLRGVITGAGGMRVVGMVADGAQALAALATISADLVLMDLSMPGMDGVTATRRITERYPGVDVVVLTSYADQSRVVEAVDAGAIGYVLKDTVPGELVAAIRSAAQGRSPLDPRVARMLLHQRQAAPSGGGELTDREQEVLALVSQGLTNKGIAHALGIREGTVKAHLTTVFHTIGVQDRTSAALWARARSPEQSEPGR